MSPPDLAPRPLVWSAVAIASAIVVCIAAAWMLLRIWQLPPGGAANVAPALLRELQQHGSALQSAPQLAGTAAAGAASRSASAVTR